MDEQKFADVLKQWQDAVSGITAMLEEIRVSDFPSSDALQEKIQSIETWLKDVDVAMNRKIGLVTSVRDDLWLLKSVVNGNINGRLVHQLSLHQKLAARDADIEVMLDQLVAERDKKGNADSIDLRIRHLAGIYDKLERRLQEVENRIAVRREGDDS